MLSNYINLLSSGTMRTVKRGNGAHNHNRTRKIQNRKRGFNGSSGGGWFDFDGIKKLVVSDNNLVNINIPSSSGNIHCHICSNDSFQMRRGTVGKSKTANVLQDAVIGSGADNLGDISINCYFCNKCGNTIFVRDPKTSNGNNYDNLIVSTPANTVNPLNAV